MINVIREDTVKCFAWEVQLTLIMCSRMVFRRTFDDDIGIWNLLDDDDDDDDGIDFSTSIHGTNHLT